MLIALQVTAWSLSGQQAHGLDIVLLLGIYIDFLLSCVLTPSLFLAKMWRYNSDLGCCLWSHLVVLSVLCPLHTNMSLVLLLGCDLKLLSFFLVLSYAYNISSFETACSITAVWFPFLWKDRYHLLVIVISSGSVCKVFLLNFVLAFLYCTYMLPFCLIFTLSLVQNHIFPSFFFTLFQFYWVNYLHVYFPSFLELSLNLLADISHVLVELLYSLLISVFAAVYFLFLSWSVCHDMFLLCCGFAGALKARRCSYSPLCIEPPSYMCYRLCLSLICSSQPVV